LKPSSVNTFGKKEDDLKEKGNRKGEEGKDRKGSKSRGKRGTGKRVKKKERTRSGTF